MLLGSSPWVLRIRGCGFFGLGSFAASGLGRGCCCFRIFWCDCFRFGSWACRWRGVWLRWCGFSVFFLLGDIHGGISKYPVLSFCHRCFLGREDIEVMALRSGSALLAGPRTGFGVVAPGDVEVIVLLAGLFAVGDFGLGRPWLLAHGACGDDFGVSEGLVAPAFWGCLILPPSGLWFFTLLCILGVVLRHQKADHTLLK